MNPTNNSTKKIVTGVVVVIVVIAIIYLIARKPSQPAPSDSNPVTTTGTVGSTASSTQTVTPTDKTQTVIGTSVAGRNIVAYHYGNGSTELLFVGGIHGGYEWNTALVAYQLIDYLKANPSVIPANVEVTVIPVLNPDGLNKVVPDNFNIVSSSTPTAFSASDITASQATQVAGRFNGNKVDLNRNFDCDWQAKAVWQSTPVSAGTAAFSEPESMAVKQYVESHAPKAVVVWYSAAGGVYASNCHTGVLPETSAILKAFADASGYSAYNSFDFYATTGDMTNWLAKNNIPAISVLLTNHSDTEWSKNLAGIKALLTYYGR